MSSGSILEQCNVESDLDGLDLEKAMQSLHYLQPSVQVVSLKNLHESTVSTKTTCTKGPKLSMSYYSLSKISPPQNSPSQNSPFTLDYSKRIAGEKCVSVKPLSLPIRRLPHKASLSSRIPYIGGDCVSLIYSALNQPPILDVLAESPNGNALSSGIREETDYLAVVRPKQIKSSALSWDQFIVASSVDGGSRPNRRKCSGLSPMSHSQHPSPMGKLRSPNFDSSQANTRERCGAGLPLDSNVDCEELLKKDADFNQYYEAKIALQKKKTSESYKKTALHAALGMPFAAKVSRTDLHSFEMFT